MRETFLAISDMAIKKRTLLHKQPFSYIWLTLLGGMFVGFGIILLITIGGLLDSSGVPWMRVLQGITFGVALTMVIMTGVDLFTGNNLVMTVGLLERKTTTLDLIKIWIVSWCGNFLGSIVCALLYYYSGLHVGNIAAYVEKLATYKIDNSFIELLMRGILCNILVCLAVYCAYKLKNEAAKIAIIFCCIFPFITAGFEHSVANMTLFSLAYMIDSTNIALSGILHNLIPVTIGNAVGGALFIGYAFWVSKY
ncbi:MAG: formate/nitrite transporter family protein [Lysinibacillus sp.]